MEAIKEGEVHAVHLDPRPTALKGWTQHFDTPEGSAFITLNHDERGDPRECFVNVGKAGSTLFAQAEALGRMISLCLALSCPMGRVQRAEEIAGQLERIGSRGSTGFGANKIFSVPDAVAKAILNDLKRRWHDQKAEAGEAVAEANTSVEPVKITGDICPSCHDATLVMQEGCEKCFSCGYSAC